MLLAKKQIRKILLLRPGALGDVLAVRPVIRFFREAFPAAEICLAAPGSRGEFFRRDGWAHRTYDWDRAPFAWLFAGGDTPPPPQLSAVFAGSDIIIAYMDFSDHAAMHAFEHALERAAPAAGKVYCPARPPAGHAMPIGEWLLQAAAAFCSRYGLLQVCDTAAAYSRLIGETIHVSAPARIPGLKPPYLAVHPGSGSRSKNWPAEYFAVLVRHLLQEENASGKIFAGAAVTSGEADGDAGARLAAAVPGAVHFSMPLLEDLAGLLAHAALYIGNDSGVSHLAAAVSPSGGVRAPAAVFFGPSDPAVWAPPGALVLPAGRSMDAMVPEEALRRIRGHYTGIFQKDLTSQPDYAE